MLVKSLTVRVQWQRFAKTRIVLVAAGILLLTAASKIYIPIKPIPMTLQTIAVLLLGLFYTPRIAFESVASWLLLATCGLPLLASSDHLLWWIGPSAGYLIGFLVAAPLMAMLQQQVFGRSQQRFINCLLGQLVIYGFGVAWLTYGMGWLRAMQVGLLPFIFPGLVKTLLLVSACRLIGGSK